MAKVIKFPRKISRFNEQERRGIAELASLFNLTPIYGQADDKSEYVVLQVGGDTIAHLGWTETGLVFLDSAISGYSEWTSVHALIEHKRKQYEGQKNDYIVIQA